MQGVLAFDSDSHIYALDGIKIPSVTTILSFGQNLSNIPAWTSLRGTAFHLATEYDDAGDLDESSIDPHVRPHLDAYRRWKRTNGSHYTHTEFKVWGELDGLKFAGTIDRVRMVLHSASETLEVWDLKSGSPRKEHGAQVTAYKLAFEQRTNYSVDRVACLYCQKDGLPLPKYYPVDECLEMFRTKLAKWYEVNGGVA